MTESKVLFMTGVTGGIGRELLRIFLERTEDRLILLVRPKASESHHQRVEKLLGKLGVNGRREGRIRVMAGDLTQPKLGLSPEDWASVVREADEFYHSAALTNLGASWEDAERINLHGTLRALELAREAAGRGRLGRFFYFSTAYVAGSLTPLHALEDELPEKPVFGNAYEATKFEAERKVREEQALGLPTTIFRPSIVVGDSLRGAVTDFNVIYPFLRLFAHGLLKRIPARLEHSFNIVPIDFVVEAAFALSRRDGTSGKAFHLVTENPPTLRMLLQVKDEYGNFPDVEVVQPENFAVEDLNPREREIFSSLDPYLGYLGSTLTFDTKNTRQALKGSGVSFPKTDRSFLKKLVDYAIQRGYFLHEK
jgi:long-chain acyl-CoA synthetase